VNAPRAEPAVTDAPARRRMWIWSGPVLLAIAGAGYWLAAGRYVATDNAYLKADVVAVGPRIEGLVATVEARSNARVRPGDPLFHLDRAPLEVELARAEANLAGARADVAALRATLERRRVESALARTTLAQAEREVRRLQPLVERGIAPRSLYDRAVYEAEAAGEQATTAARAIGEAEAALGPAVAGPGDAHPRVRLALAELAQARLNLDYARVAAPVAGTLATVTLHPGEHVAPGRAVLHLVVGDRPWVEANLKETQLRRLAPGQPARVEIDSYPGLAWQARVASISPATGAEFALLPPENASGNWVKVVQRVPLRLELLEGGPNLPLRAGMSVSVRIDTGESNVRFRRYARALAAYAGS